MAGAFEAPSTVLVRPAMSTQNSENYEPGESFNQHHTPGCSFDVDMEIDPAAQKGEVIVRMEFDKEEAESVWEQIQGDGHTYPETARERVLKALECNVQCAGRGD